MLGCICISPAAWLRLIASGCLHQLGIWMSPPSLAWWGLYLQHHWVGCLTPIFPLIVTRSGFGGAGGGAMSFMQISSSRLWFLWLTHLLPEQTSSAMPAPKCPDKKESELRMCCQPRRCAALCHPFGHHLLWPFCRDLLAREGVCMDGGKPPPGSQNWSTGVWHGQERTWRHLLYVDHSHYALASTAPQLGESMNPKSDKWEQMMRSTRKKL